MALTEQTILSSINHNVEAQTFDVKWLKQVLRDGEVISSTPHRTAFSVSEIPAFTAAIGNDATAYFASIEAEIRGGALNMLEAERSDHAQQLAKLTADNAEAIATKDAANAKALADKDTANAAQLAHLTDQANLQISTLRATIANMQAQIDGAAK